MVGKGINFLAFMLVVLTLLNVAIAQPPPQVKVGFSPHSLEVEPGSTFTLKLVIFEGGSLVRAGEFNISSSSDSLELVNMTPVNEWILTKVHNKYVFYTLKVQPDETVLAELQFKCKQDTPANVTLLYFKAADAQGRDLTVSLEPSTVQVKIKRPVPLQPPGETPPSVPMVRERGPPLILIVALVTTISAAIVAAVAVYFSRSRAVSAYSLVDRSGRVVFHSSSRDRVFGREDFVGILPPNRLVYITRRASGGQFRIVRGQDGWYIIDSYSTNPTLVNGTPIKGRGYLKLKSGDSISVQGVFELYFQGG